MVGFTSKFFYKSFMKVSIIVTNFNYGKYIDRCIRSCLNQNYSVGLKNLKKDFEVIVVDDCSKDNSREKIRRFNKVKNFRYIFNKKNIGVAASANEAIRESKGKYFVRVDSDDFISSYLINILSYFLDENPNFFGVACDYYHVDKFENKTKKIQSEKFPISCGIMYNKKKFIKYGMYKKEFRHREEEELKIRLGEKYKIFNLPLPLYRYRMHTNNKTKSNDYLKDFKNKILDLSFDKLKKSKNKLLSNIILIIPARGNSKRFKSKNIFKLKNKPMIYYAIQAAKNSRFLKQIYVSSESKRIMNIASKYKVKIIKRPNYLSKDKVFKIEVIRHAVREIEKNKKKLCSLVVSLQPNSPEVKSFQIDSAIKKLIENNLQEVITVDANLNSNAAIRVMKRNALFQESLSTYLGCIKTDINDIHYKKDLKKIDLLKF